MLFSVVSLRKEGVQVGITANLQGEKGTVYGTPGGGGGRSA